jgi:hypothetical protein
MGAMIIYTNYEQKLMDGVRTEIMTNYASK